MLRSGPDGHALFTTPMNPNGMYASGAPGLPSPTPSPTLHSQILRSDTDTDINITAAEAPEAPVTAYLALDTNVLLDHFSLVRSLYARMLAGDAWLLVPATVVTELDGLKSSVNPVRPGSDTCIGDVARAATAWLLDVVRAQRNGAPGRLRLERWSDAAKAVPGGNRADDSILACCIHFAEAANVTLWTNDRNLALLAEANEIPTVGGNVPFARLCAAVGVVGVSEMEAMDCDGDADMIDTDLPLFSRRRRAELHTAQIQSHSAPSGATAAQGVTYYAELPPADALRTALAELKGSSFARSASAPRLGSESSTQPDPGICGPSPSAPISRRLSNPSALPAPISPSVSAAVVPILSTVCASVTPDAPLSSTPLSLATTLAGALAALVIGPPPAAGDLDTSRQLARCADAARTVRAWLTLPSPGGQRVRSGQAAEAILVLFSGLSSLGMALNEAAWAKAAAIIRQS